MLYIEIAGKVAVMDGLYKLRHFILRLFIETIKID